MFTQEICLFLTNDRREVQADDSDLICVTKPNLELCFTHAARQHAELVDWYGNSETLLWSKFLNLASRRISKKIQLSMSGIGCSL